MAFEEDPGALPEAEPVERVSGETLKDGIAVIAEAVKTLPNGTGRLPYAQSARRRALRRQGAEPAPTGDQL